MKKDIHPQMKLVTVKCACGAEHRFYTVKDTIRIDVCSNCHPLYKGHTSAGLVIDTEGRIEKFKRRYEGVEY